MRQPARSGYAGPPRTPQPERPLPSAASLLRSWSTKKMSISPFGAGWWSFNPSIHYDRFDGAWRLVFRCANYSLPGGVPKLSSEARQGRASTRNAIAILDPFSLELGPVREMRELDGQPRAPSCSSLGYEDMRLFRTERDGLCGIATGLQLNEERPGCPEMVLCRIDHAGDIVEASPLRGPWSHRPQKNWSPFDGTAEPRLLYSIERGVIMSDVGPVTGAPTPRSTWRSPTVAAGTGRGASEVKVMGVQPSAHHPPRPSKPAPGSSELRGGTQLIEIEDNRWLGLAHEMKLKQPNRRKFYWHTFYTCDGWGRVTERSPPFKLSPQHGIEFAAGMAIDGRGGVAISYGTDDHDSWIGVTDLESVLRILAPAAPKTKSDDEDQPASW